MTFPPSAVIYLDHHSTTPVDPRVLEAMWPYFGSEFANASSQHQPGRTAWAAVEQAREELARCWQISPREIVFTSGATEANNLAIKGILQASPEGSHLVVTAAEHSSVLDVALRMRRRGYRVTIVPVDKVGRVSPEAIAQAITDATVLVSVMLANNEVGTINDLAAIGEICRDEGIPLHTDAVAAFGRIPIDLSKMPVTLASFSAHKIYGPKGMGALVLRKGETRIRLEPQLDGGGQEHRLRSGTLPVPLIVGFGVAGKLVTQELPTESQRLEELSHRFQSEISQRLTGLRWNGPTENRLPGNVNFSVEDVDGSALFTALEADLAVSSGAACSSSNPEPSHVLRAMGVPDLLCRASLRLGFGRTTTIADVSRAVEVMTSAVNRLRSLGHQ